MEDRELHKRIADLVAEERELEEGHIGTWATPEQEKRLREVREALDQSWDLLRQRRARREFHQDITVASPDRRRSWSVTSSRPAGGAGISASGSGQLDARPQSRESGHVTLACPVVPDLLADQRPTQSRKLLRQGGATFATGVLDIAHAGTTGAGTQQVALPGR